jgi:Flp pilus assembly protein TadD
VFFGGGLIAYAPESPRANGKYRTGGSSFRAITSFNPLSSNWQRQVITSSGYLELGMLEDAALALAEIAPEDEKHIEVLEARLALHLAGRNWRMAAAVAHNLVQLVPQNPSWWIRMAYAVRRAETIEKAEAILLEAHKLHPKNPIILLNLASYASVTGRTEEAKSRLRSAIRLDRQARRLALDIQDLRPLWDWISDIE